MFADDLLNRSSQIKDNLRVWHPHTSICDDESLPRTMRCESLLAVAFRSAMFPRKEYDRIRFHFASWIASNLVFFFEICIIGIGHCLDASSVKTVLLHDHHGEPQLLLPLPSTVFWTDWLIMLMRRATSTRSTTSSVDAYETTENSMCLNISVAMESREINLRRQHEAQRWIRRTIEFKMCW